MTLLQILDKVNESQFPFAPEDGTWVISKDGRTGKCMDSGIDGLVVVGFPFGEERLPIQELRLHPAEVIAHMVSRMEETSADWGTLTYRDIFNETLAAIE
jgi:hypothetical protein